MLGAKIVLESAHQITQPVGVAAIRNVAREWPIGQKEKKENHYCDGYPKAFITFFSLFLFLHFSGFQLLGQKILFATLY
jgi:hypothetical protein